MLTEKKDKFAQHYARHRSGPAAYVAAYDARNCMPATIANEASKLLRDPEVTARLAELTEAATVVADVTLDLAAILQHLCLQVTTDPRELMVIKTGNCRHCNGDGFAYRWREEEYREAINLWQLNATKNVDPAVNPIPDASGGFGFRPFHPPNPECPECGGAGLSHAGLKPTDEYSPGAVALFDGFRPTANGIELKIADRSKARETIVRMLGGFNDSLDLKTQLNATIRAAVAVATDQRAAALMYEQLIKIGKS